VLGHLQSSKRQLCQKKEWSMDNENKIAWCKHGERLELDFVSRYSIDSSKVYINPDKSEDPYTHDLRIDYPADLKSITTPWNMSMQMFGIPPEFAVSINEKDFIRYAKLYPNIRIILHIKYPGYSEKVYEITVAKARYLIKRKMAHRHEYKNRKNDTKGNAKVSYIFDLRDLEEIKWS